MLESKSLNKLNNSSEKIGKSVEFIQLGLAKELNAPLFKRFDRKEIPNPIPVNRESLQLFQC